MSGNNQLNSTPNTLNPQQQAQLGQSYQQQSYINFTNPNMFQANSNQKSSIYQQGMQSSNFNQINQNGNLQIPDLINFKLQTPHASQGMRSFSNQQGGQTAEQEKSNSNFNIPPGNFNFNFFNFQHKPPMPPPLPQNNPNNNPQNRFNINQKRPYYDQNNYNRNNPSQGNHSFNNNQNRHNKQGGNNKHGFNPNQQNKQINNNQGNNNQTQGNSYLNQANNGQNKNNNQKFNNKMKLQQNNLNQFQEEKQQQLINNQEGEINSVQKQQQGRNNLQQKHPHQNNERKGQFQQGRNHSNMQKDQKQKQMNQQIYQQDNQEEVLKWIESRKRNYPSSENILRKKAEQNQNEQSGHVSLQELSKLEIKLRKKIQIGNASIKKLEVQQKHYDMLRKLYTEGDKAPKQRKINNETENRYKQSGNRYDQQNKKQNDRTTDSKKPIQTEKIIYTPQELKKNLKIQNKLKQKLSEKRVAYFQILETIKNRNLIYENVQQIIDEKKKEELQNQSEQSEINQIDKIKEQKESLQENNEDDEMPIEVPLVSLKENKADTTNLIQQQLESSKKAEIVQESKNSNKRNKKKQTNLDIENEQEDCCDNVGCEKDKIKDMILELKEKRDKYSSELDLVFNYKANSSNFRYKTNTLLTNLVLDEIYKERNYILQAIRYMVTNNFFDEEVTTKPENTQPTEKENAIELEKSGDIEQMQEEKQQQSVNDQNNETQQIHIDSDNQLLDSSITELNNSQ